MSLLKVLSTNYLYKVCGGYLDDTSGYIKARWDENCEWKIESEGSKIFLNILHLECDCSKHTNCTNGLKVSVLSALRENLIFF